MFLKYLQGYHFLGQSVYRVNNCCLYI